MTTNRCKRSRREQRRPRRGGERGSVSLLIVILGGVLLLLAGLVYDTGTILNARQSAYAAAAEASRSGAQALTPNLRTTSVDVDSDQAASAAANYLAPLGYQSATTVNADTVTVTVHREMDLGGLGRLLNLPTATITATATSRATRGVRKETP